jgi:hypothetical protein
MNERTKPARRRRLCRTCKDCVAGMCRITKVPIDNTCAGNWCWEKRRVTALVQCSYLKCDGHSCGGAHTRPHAKTDACLAPCKPGDHRCVAVSKRKAGKA